MGYADHPSYIWVMAITVALDAFQCIPFAYLRYKKRPVKFAALKLANILMSIALNLVFFPRAAQVVRKHRRRGHSWQNLLAGSGASATPFTSTCSARETLMLLLVKELTGFKYVFEPRPAAPHAIVQLAHLGAGNCRNTEPDGRQNPLPVHLPRRGRPLAARHIRRGQQNSDDYGDDNTGLPLRLRAVRVRQGEGQGQPRHLRQGDEVLCHLHTAGLPRRHRIHGHTEAPHRA